MRIEAIAAHPGLNPEFFAGMRRRKYAQNWNRAAPVGFMQPIAVPKQPNRYMPHTGAKEAARHAGKGSLGPNASRALR